MRGPSLPPRGSWSARWTLAVGLAAGGVAGFLELVPILVAARVGVHVRMGPHLTWMVPASELLIFAGVAAALAALGAAWPRLHSRRLVTGVFGALGALALLLLLERLHDLALTALAAGVGVQLARWAYTRPVEAALRAAPVAAAALPLAVGLLALGTFRSEARSEARLVEELPAAAEGGPDILLLILDTVRARSLGLYGGPAATSTRLSGLASRGVVFDRAIAPSPWTLPSHASFFTGRWPFELDAGWESPLGPTHPTLAERLTRAGWVTAGFSANLLNVSRVTGLDRGFLHWEDHVADPGELLLSSSLVRALAYSTTVRRLLARHELLNRKHAPELNEAFLAWLDRRAPDGTGGSGTERRPWFAFLNYYDAHEPYMPPPAVAGGREWNAFEHRGGLLVGGNAWVGEKWTLPPEGVATHRAGYEAALARLDAEVGRLLDELERRGELDETLVIITSDHGEQLGERGLFEHNNSLYLPALRVPLVVIGTPRVPAGVRVDATVSLRDLPATILDLAGLPASLPGTSLAPTWGETEGGGDGGPPSPALSHLTRGFVEQPGAPIDRGRTPEMHSLVELPFHYVHNGDGTDELYDYRMGLDAPPNLAGTPAGDSVLIRLRAILYPTVTGDAVPPAGLPILPATPPGG